MTIWKWSGRGTVNYTIDDPTRNSSNLALNWFGNSVPVIAQGDVVDLTPVQIGNNIPYIISLNGTLQNPGEIDLNYANLPGGSFGMYARIYGTVTLSGHGTVKLHSGNFDANGVPLTPVYITGATPLPTLENVDNTISGVGYIVGLNLINDANGVINADQTIGSLTLGLNSITNSGLLEATGAAGLTINAPVTIDQSQNGRILAAGGDVNFVGGVRVFGGTLSANTGNKFNSLSGAPTLDGTGALPVTITAGTRIVLDYGLQFAAAAGQTNNIINRGVLQVSSVSFGNSGTPDPQTPGGKVRLSGGGTLSVNGSINSATPSSGTAFENVDNTIIGSFIVGSNITNDAAGIMNVTAAGAFRSAVVTNNGLIEATGAGALTLSSATIDQSGGGRLVADGGSILIGTPQGNAAAINGGTIEAKNGGAFTVVNPGLSNVVVAYFDGTNASGLTIAAGTALATADGGPSNAIQFTAAQGTTSNIVNRGVLVDTSTFLIGSGSGSTVKFSGGGAINLTTADSNIAGGATAPATTTMENFDNRITGQGSIGLKRNAYLAGGNLSSLRNDTNGVIIANVTGGTLRINSSQIVNNGRMAADGGILILDGAVTGGGSTSVGLGGSLIINSTFNQFVSFGQNGSLSLSNPYSGTLAGFGLGDSVTLSNLAYSAGDHFVWQNTSAGLETFALKDGANNVLTNLTFGLWDGAFRFHNYSTSSFKIANDGSGHVKITYTGLAGAKTTQRDFNADGLSDLLWQNTGGAVGYWNAGSGSAYAALGSAGSDWRIAGIGDFNGDGRADVLWRNTSGAVGMWSAGSASSYVALGGAGSDWQIAGIGDFNYDGKADVLWRNTSGAVGYWSAGSGSAYTALGSAGSDWRIAGVGDFNGDGPADVLWRNTSGAVGVWSAGSASAYVGLGGAGSDWQITGTGDFDGDNISDVLWRNASGTVGYWASGSAGAFTALGGAGADWQIAGVSDFNGDGLADVLWRNSSGAVGAWQSAANGTHPYVSFGGADSSWQIRAA